MSGPDGGLDHRQAWELIPWVINGRASAADRQVLEVHLQACNDCCEEFQFQSRLHASIAGGPAPAGEPQAVLERHWLRVDRLDEAIPAIDTRKSGAPARWLIAAVVVEAIGVAALASAMWTRADQLPAAYRTLTAADPAAGRATIRVVLAPDLTISQVQALLEQSQLQIVDGPSEDGVYSLAPRASQAAAEQKLTLTQLRAQPGVRFAEPIGGAP